MELGDYLHYHLGCDVLIINSIITGTGDTGIVQNKILGRLTTAGILGNIKQRFRVLIEAMSTERPFNFETDKLILRPLSDITDEEHIESSVAYTDAESAISFDFSEWYRQWHGEAARTRYLISKGFNILDPEWKYSIDKTKLL